MAIITRSLSILLLGAGAFALNACSDEFVNTATYGIFPQQESNLLQQGNAVADYLISRASDFVEKDDLIVVLPLEDVNQPNMSSEISKMIPEMVGTRLAELGYKVDLSRVADPASNYMKPASISGRPDFLLSGTYLRNRVDMDVNMRITEAASSRVVSAFDYVMPLNREIAALAKPQPKIIRMEQQTIQQQSGSRMRVEDRTLRSDVIGKK